MPEPRTYVRGEVREALKLRVAEAYRNGATIRECMAVTEKSYGATHRLLLESGVELRPGGGDRWKGQKDAAENGSQSEE